jgi:8-oxo-dGTP diphosphatase
MHVAVAVIANSRGEVLITRRANHVHQGGLWEFPGGKVEAGESVQHALKREIHEELGIDIEPMHRLIRVPYRYTDRHVLLDVWKVDPVRGQVCGREGQPLAWTAIESLDKSSFPAANRSIIAALNLPDRCLITPEPERGVEPFLERLERCLQHGIRLVQLRCKSLGRKDYEDLAMQVLQLCRSYDARLLLNTAAAAAERLGADGVHLDSRRLANTDARPLPADKWVGVSCHAPADLELANAIGADLAMLSPVKPTATHPGADPLGWDRFAEWADRCAIPVYALGGMKASDVDTARAAGAQGIAAIRALWDLPNAF